MIVHIPAADAMKYSDALRRFCKISLFVSNKNLPARWAVFRRQALELQCREDPGIAPVAEFRFAPGVKGVVAGGDDDGTDLEHLFLLPLVPVHSAFRTGQGAGRAVLALAILDQQAVFGIYGVGAGQ